MAWLAVDEDGEEYIYETLPERDGDLWNGKGIHFLLPKGSIQKLIGKQLTWDDEPFELKDE
jgi:hypothetical protein